MEEAELWREGSDGEKWLAICYFKSKVPKIKLD